jgi:hypothetical protein
MFIFCHQQAVPRYIIKINTKCLKCGKEFKYLETTLTNQIFFLKKLRTD